MRPWIFTLGTLLVLVPEILRVYFIMPFPGSQQDMPGGPDQVETAYWLHNNIWWIRMVGLALMTAPFVHYLRRGSKMKRIAVLLPLVVCALVVYAFNFRFMADKMFLVPKEKTLLSVAQADATSNELVLMVERHGDARAYPVEVLGYHHQVLDTFGREPVLITYCTVCRTGRAWSPVINGEVERFRLVGMDHFNAMFEDTRTKSWWRQVNGECIAGPLKGTRMQEVPSAQMSFGEFARLHPAGQVLQPDRNFIEEYAELDGFDEGTVDSSLEQRDTASWRMKSWVLGVVHKGAARAYDWNDLVALRTVVDTLAGDSIIIQLRPDDASFVVSRQADPDASVATEAIPAYQEFWHSWLTFQPSTTRYQRVH